MKRLALISVLYVFSTLARAQNCNFFYLQNGRTAELSFTNKKGKETSRMVYKVSDVKKSGKVTTAVVNSEMFDKKGKSASKAVNNVKCDAGVLMMDMKMFISPEQQEQLKGEAKAADVYLSYPAAMKTGDALADGSFNVDVHQDNGMKSSVDIKITERKVGDKESVTSAAGTWECYRISYHSVIKIAVMGIGFPIKMDITEWFAPNFGVVKSESKHGTTLLTKFE